MAPVQHNSVECLSEYKVDEDWTDYSKKLDQLFKKECFDNDRKVAILLAFLGKEAYGVLKCKCDPIPPKDKTYEQLEEILKKNFSTQEAVFHKRSIFYDAMQERNEAVSDWFARIKSLAAPCEFGNQLDDKIKDKFITGLEKGEIFYRLCRVNCDRKLSDLVDIAVKTEVALKLLTVIEKDISCISTFAKDGKEKRSTFNKCLVCGRQNHNCRFKNFTCNICNKH